jgi:hypothetical protein
MFGFYGLANWYDKEIDEHYKEEEECDEPKKRTDYCWDCRNDKLYTHAMTFKCSICDKIILGGEK